MESLPALARLADHLLDEGLAAFLADRRGANGNTVAWDRIARDLWVVTEAQVDTTGVTVQKWARLLGVESAA